MVIVVKRFFPKPLQDGIYGRILSRLRGMRAPICRAAIGLGFLESRDIITNRKMVFAGTLQR